MRARLGVLTLVLIAMPAAARAGGGVLWASDPAGTDALWSGTFGFPQFDGPVWTAMRSGKGLVVGGTFEIAGGTPAHFIARWDGTRWWPLGDGIPNSPSALAVAGDTVWAAWSPNGGFGNSGSIARWDGTRWSVPLLTGYVSSADYHAGLLTVLDLSPSGHYEVWRWDGVNRIALGGPGDLIGVSTLRVEGDSIYVGGRFADTTAIPPILKVWDGAAWSVRARVTETVDQGAVLAIGSLAGQLVIGGEFTSVDGVAVTHIARRVGSSWQTMGGPLSPQVRQITDDGAGHLLIFGPPIGTPPGPGLLQWDGSRWIGTESPVGPNPAGVVGVGGARFIYGYLESDENQNEIHSLARVDAGVRPLPTPGASAGGFGGPLAWGAVKAIAEFQSSVFVAGTVTLPGELFTPFPDRVLMRTADGAWQPITDPSFLGGQLFALFADPYRLIAGGRFSLITGPVYHNCAAQWDGAHWSPLGDFDNAVRAFAVYHGDLYAGGDFETADHLLCHHVARWNGTQWLPVGPVTAARDAAPLGGVLSLVVWKNRLYAGGSFLQMGGDTTIHNVAAWDGAQWSRVGSGLPIPPVGALAATDSVLYAGPGVNAEVFTSDRPIEVWDGVTWQTIPTPDHAGVQCLLATPSGLYVGATFDDGAGAWVGLARLTAGQWSMVGSGLRGPADWNVATSALALLPDGLWAGGAFTVAGGHSSSRIARFDGLASAVPPPGSNAISMAPMPTAGHVTLRFQIVAPGRVLARVYDISGREVAVAHDAVHGAGPVIFDWDAASATHGALKSGIYLMRIESPGASPRTARIALVR